MTIIDFVLTTAGVIIGMVLYRCIVKPLAIKIHKKIKGE